jgi:hypothetical protein
LWRYHSSISSQPEIAPIRAVSSEGGALFSAVRVFTAPTTKDWSVIPWSLTLRLTIAANICYAEIGGLAMRREKTGNERNWKEWFQSRPLIVLVGAAITVSSSTAAVVTYFFVQKKELADQLHAAELQQVKSDLTAKIKELEVRLLSIERHVGTETIWDVSQVLVSRSQVSALGSEFTYFDDLQCYLLVPKSEIWAFKKMSELEFTGMLLGSKWVEGQRATPLGRMMSDLKIACWRGPDTFDIETTEPELPVIHAFPYVFIERVNNRKLRQSAGKFIDEQELEAKQKAAKEAKRALDEKGGEKIPPDVAAKSPSPNVTGSPSAEGENPASAQASEVEAREAYLNLLLDSDIVGSFLNYNLSGVIQTTALIKDASFDIIKVEKKGNVFYLHSRLVAPASGTRPKVYLDKESICIGDNEDTVIIQTCAPSTDGRPPEGAWIARWFAGLRVVSR